VRLIVEYTNALLLINARRDASPAIVASRRTSERASVSRAGVARVRRNDPLNITYSERWTRSWNWYTRS